jgi:hypothetical protein
VAAKYGRLPADFSAWELADKKGWTVAHEAAKARNLPKEFELWDLANKEGKTVREVAAEAESSKISKD